MPGKKWTKAEEQYLIDNHVNKTCEEIGIIMGKTTRSIQHKYNKLELEKPTPSIEDKIHRLTIVEKYIKPHYNQNATFVIAECECGKIKEYLLKAITSNNTKSCGCYQSDIQRKLAIKRNYKHGQSQNNNHLFKTWIRINAICNIPSATGYPNFGGRGIKVEECWKEFVDFQKWSSDNGYKNKLSIKRYNKDKNFCPENCYWIDKNYTKERLYKIWSGLFIRCYDNNFVQYCSYGGRGIKVVDVWHNYINFKNWSLQNNYDINLSIDRIDNNWHYCPENCRWATQQEQNESRHNNRPIIAFNEVKSLLHWTKDARCHADIETIKKRLSEGWSTEDAISKSV